MLSRLQADSGSATAEFAVALPAVILVLGFGVSVISAMGTQSTHVALAQRAAGSLARGIEQGTLLENIEATAPGAKVEFTVSSTSACVKIFRTFKINFAGEFDLPPAQACSPLE